MRYDYNSIHGSIVSPRINYKWSSHSKRSTLRLSAGNGYRVANIFTEDHAALNGARELVVENELAPETSWNANLNFVQSFVTSNRTFINLDATIFYTYFTNQIIPDYDTDPNKIIYANLDGYSVSQGVSINTNITFPIGLSINSGFTAMDVHFVDDGIKERPYLTERINAVYTISYPFSRIGLTVDLTGNLYGPMRLPLLSELDPRAPESPWWGNQNFQLTKVFRHGFTVYGGVKNFLNYTPPANSIARAHDPFDKQVDIDAQGNVIATPQNPYALTFDPSYVFAPNQGIRFFFGVRYQLN
jgi:outer membrane receptor for ferrienterochelin and colicins